MKFYLLVISLKPITVGGGALAIATFCSSL